jgi:amino acid permease
MFSYPLQVHPCRASIDAILKWRPQIRILYAQKTLVKPRADIIGDTRFAAITTGVIVLSYICAITISSLEKVLAHVGSTGSTSLSFNLPGLFDYKISAPESPQHQKLMKKDDDEEESESEDEGLLGGGRLKTGP